MNKSFITFDVRCTSTSKSLSLEVNLDSEIVYANNISTKETIKIQLPDNEDQHSLKIILKNKTADHTVLDPLGAIVQDANLLIDNIKFDDVLAEYNLLQLATYTHDCNGTDELKEHKFYDVMGCNGTVEFKFTTPIYLWLLEHS